MSAPRSGAEDLANFMGVAVSTAESYIRKAGKPAAFQAHDAELKAVAALSDLAAVKFLDPRDFRTVDEYQSAVSGMAEVSLREAIAYIEPPSCRCRRMQGSVYVETCRLHHPGKVLVHNADYEGEFSAVPVDISVKEAWVR